MSKFDSHWNRGKNSGDAACIRRDPCPGEQWIAPNPSAGVQRPTFEQASLPTGYPDQASFKYGWQDQPINWKICSIQKWRNSIRFLLIYSLGKDNIEFGVRPAVGRSKVKNRVRKLQVSIFIFPFLTSDAEKQNFALMNSFIFHFQWQDWDFDQRTRPDKLAFLSAYISVGGWIKFV